MASKAKAAPKRPKKNNGYEKPKPLKPGDVLKDNQKGEWKVGVSIGVGGFGEIYSACKVGSLMKLAEYPYVIKIEPKENGPLFVEMHFYLRMAKQESINLYKKDNKLKALGMPVFIGTGTHEIQQIKHRFVVLPRYGSDIWKIFLEKNREFPLHTVFRLGWQLINVLEFIHKGTYVHGDIKGSNILLGFGKGGDEQVHLLDYGLACHYNTKEFKPDPKKMHNGTIEYLSRDAHQGVPTMRGDIEILAYNLIEWAGAKLPWVAKKLLEKPTDVQKSKEEFMKSVEKSLKSSFGTVAVPRQLLELFKYVEAMTHDAAPDYAKIRGMLEAGIKELGQKNSGVLEFAAKAAKKEPAKKAPVGRPNFADMFGDSPKPEPEKKLPATKRSVTRKKYVEPDSVSDGDNDDDFVPKKKVAKKAPAVKKAAAVKKQPEAAKARATKRGREVKNQIVESSEDEDEIPSPKKSPQKRAKPQEAPARSTSKENHKSPNVSPPTKKTKDGDDKTKKSSTADSNGTALGSVRLESKSKSSKNKKTIQLNFNLDVSMNSDLVVVVNRKDKKTNKDSEEVEASAKVVVDEPIKIAGVYKGKHAKAK